MKNFTMQLTIAAAALAAVAGSASAQTYKAEIPVAFHAGSKAMAAGYYDFVVTTSAAGHRTVAVRNNISKDAALLLPIAGSDAPKAWQENGNPKIALECLAGACTLRRLWDGGRDNPTYDFPAHKLAPADKERLAVLTVGLTKAD